MLLNFFTAPSLPPSLTSLILTAILQTGGKVVYTGLPKAHNKGKLSTLREAYWYTHWRQIGVHKGYFLVLVQLCSSILDMCGGGGRPKKEGEDEGEEEVVCWEQRSSSSFLSRGWSDLTASGGLVRKIPTTERPPGSIADTCREERMDTQ